MTQIWLRIAPDSVLQFNPYAVSERFKNRYSTSDISDDALFGRLLTLVNGLKDGAIVLDAATGSVLKSTVRDAIEQGPAINFVSRIMGEHCEIVIRRQYVALSTSSSASAEIVSEIRTFLEDIAPTSMTKIEVLD